jgi:hypothetical protein
MESNEAQYLFTESELNALIADERAAEREAIAKMFEEAPRLVEFAKNDMGGCLVCGFTPRLAAESIRARGQQ